MGTKGHHSKLTPRERDQLARWKAQGVSNGECARRLGRHKSSIGRELKRNAWQGTYVAIHAQGEAGSLRIYPQANPVKHPLLTLSFIISLQSDNPSGPGEISLGSPPYSRSIYVTVLTEGAMNSSRARTALCAAVLVLALTLVFGPGHVAYAASFAVNTYDDTVDANRATVNAKTPAATARCARR